jgi:hypothetical protein
MYKINKSRNRLHNFYNPYHEQIIIGYNIPIPERLIHNTSDPHPAIGFLHSMSSDWD